MRCSGVCVNLRQALSAVFFFNDTAATDIYTLSLHDALPISDGEVARRGLEDHIGVLGCRLGRRLGPRQDRKSTRLNSSHRCISYAVFCLKKKRTVQPLGPSLPSAAAATTTPSSRSGCPSSQP